MISKMSRHLTFLTLLATILFLPRESSAAITYHISGTILNSTNGAPLINVGDIWSATFTIDENLRSGTNPVYYEVTAGEISFPSGYRIDLNVELGLLMIVSNDWGGIGHSYIEWMVCCPPDFNGQPFWIANLYLQHPGNILSSNDPPLFIDPAQWEFTEIELQFADGVNVDDYVIVNGRITSTESVPEPKSVTLIMAGIGVIGLLRLRSHRP